MNNNYLLDNIYQQMTSLSRELMKIWLGSILFSWRWWFGIILTLVPWILWIKFHDKTKTSRLTFVGLFAACTTNFLDIIGLSFGLWHYDWKVFPFIASYIPWDYALFPVSVMFLVQIKPKMNSWLKGIIFSFFCAYIFEPLFVWLKMYHVLKWHNYYSFFIYIILFYIYNRIYKAKFLSNSQ